MPSPDAGGSLPPRVLLIMPEQWPRAMLRAALREAGYDAVGAPGMPAALRYRVDAPGRGPVRLVLVDQAALPGDEAARRLGELLRRHHEPVPLLLARAIPAVPLPGGSDAIPWRRVLRRPVSVGDLVAAVQEVLPLASGSRQPLD
jgi:hypothetical protein